MVGVHLIINGRDFGRILTDYKLRQEIKYDQIVTTMDGTEHPYGRTSRDVMEFSTFLMLDRFADDLPRCRRLL